jgi:hypothetical protein
MLDKETSMMTYHAWRHNLPVRGPLRGARLRAVRLCGHLTHTSPVR